MCIISTIAKNSQNNCISRYCQTQREAPQLAAMCLVCSIVSKNNNVLGVINSLKEQEYTMVWCGLSVSVEILVSNCSFKRHLMNNVDLIMLFCVAGGLTLSCFGTHIIFSSSSSSVLLSTVLSKFKYQNEICMCLPECMNLLFFFKLKF